MAWSRVRLLCWKVWIVPWLTRVTPGSRPRACTRNTLRSCSAPCTPADVVAVRDVGQRLEGIRRLVAATARERVVPVIPVGVRPGQVQNRRCVSERVDRAREGIVVVRDPTVIDGADDDRPDADAQPVCG